MGHRVTSYILLLCGATVRTTTPIPMIPFYLEQIFCVRLIAFFVGMNNSEKASLADPLPKKARGNST